MDKNFPQSQPLQPRGYVLVINLGNAMEGNENLFGTIKGLPLEVNHFFRNCLPPLLVSYDGHGPEVDRASRLLTSLPGVSRSHPTMRFEHDLNILDSRVMCKLTPYEPDDDTFDIAFTVFVCSETGDADIEVSITGPSIHSLAEGFSQFVFDTSAGAIESIFRQAPTTIPEFLADFMWVEQRDA
jgi:hypothetical protein